MYQNYIGVIAENEKKCDISDYGGTKTPTHTGKIGVFW
jgi:hypothetical protein